METHKEKFQDDETQHNDRYQILLGRLALQGYSYNVLDNLKYRISGTFATTRCNIRLKSGHEMIF